MIIMRPSHKQHVGLLPDDVFRGPKLSKSLSHVASLNSAQPLSSYHIDALASRLSPHTKDIYCDKSTTEVVPLVGVRLPKRDLLFFQHQDGAVFPCLANGDGGLDRRGRLRRLVRVATLWRAR